MTNIKMPEPVAWVSHVTLKTLSRGKSVTAYPQETSWLAHGLITTTQAEAYAEARMKEALEAAEDAVTTLYEADEGPFLVEIARAIRTLIPKENN